VTITEFLEARIAEDEALARAATPGPWESMTEETADGENIYFTVERGRVQILDVTATDHQGRMTADFIARYDPTRALAECAAKRAVIGWWTEGLIGYVRVDGELTNPILPLAAVYKDHPDYQQEWAL